MKQSRLRRRLASLMLFSALSLSVFSTSAFARGNQETSRGTLNSTIVQAVEDKTYQTEKGGYVRGSTLVDNDAMVTPAFDSLTSKAKQQLLNDMNEAADNKIKKDESSDSSDSVSSDTKNDWLTELQQCNGIGSQLMTTLLSDTKPDYVTAHRIYEPFSGGVGTIMGLGAILIMAGIGLSIVVDLAWINVPFFRVMMNGDGDKPSKIISHEAQSAVRVAEGNDSGSGKGIGKSASFEYLKKKTLNLIVLGICLLYLVQGQIFTLVGMILDLTSGFLGF